MGSGLKFLVGAACVMIIAAGGYYLSKEYRSAVASPPVAIRKMDRQPCTNVMMALDEGRVSGDDLLIIDQCHQAGLMSDYEVNRALAARKKRLGG